MKKKMYTLLFGLSLAALLVGCNNQVKSSNNSTESSNNSTESSQVAKEETIVNGIELKVSDFKEKTVVDSKQKKYTVYYAKVTGENVSSNAKGLGAIDFLLKTKDGKEKEVSTDLNSFGNEIPPQDTIEGELYFPLTKDDVPKSIEYKPANKVLYSWNIAK